MKKIFIILLVMFVSNVWANKKSDIEIGKDVAKSTIIFCAKKGLDFPKNDRKDKCSDLKYLVSGGLLHHFQGSDNDFIDYAKTAIIIGNVCEVACNNPNKTDELISLINKVK